MLQEILTIAFDGLARHILDRQRKRCWIDDLPEHEQREVYLRVCQGTAMKMFGKGLNGLSRAEMSQVCEIVDDVIENERH